jgi:hypothetical protein|tara:strand:+ start:89631 stop:89810 length:180 start_codon:yes stop_codon:yes gene_type:complete
MGEHMAASFLQRRHGHRPLAQAWEYSLGPEPHENPFILRALWQSVPALARNASAYDNQF